MLSPPRKRVPVRKSDRKFLLKHQKGTCWRCKKSFKQMSVRPILHHKNLNPKDNRISNIILICPNCHDKIHQTYRKIRRVVRGPFGINKVRIVKIKKGGKRKKRRSGKRKIKKPKPLIYLPKPLIKI